MLLTPDQAAVLMGCTPRAVRYRLKAGALRGKKRGGRWALRRADLPLSEAAQQDLQARADAIRDAVDRVLPSRVATRRGQRPTSFYRGLAAPRSSRVVRTRRGLFEALIDDEYLEHAAARALRGKRRRPDAAWFFFRQPSLVPWLRSALRQRTWRPSRARLRTIRDPKPRIIACAPIADRVVHTALVMLAEPIIMRSAMPDAFACRLGGGTHRAVLALLAHQRRHRFVLHLDVRRFFPSVHLPTLQRLLARPIADAAFLEVFGHVLTAGARVYQVPVFADAVGLPQPWPVDRGLPIGALTSQLCAGQVYLQALDHFVKRTLRVPGYVRYMDDLFLFDDGRPRMRAIRKEVTAWLRGERGLELKHPDAPVLPCAGPLDALGHRIRREGISALPRVLRRMRRRAADAARGAVSVEAFERSVRAACAAAMF